MHRKVSPPTEEIAERWETSTDQLAETAAAMRSGDPDLANPKDKVDLRRERLRAQKITLEGVIGSDESVWLSFFSRGLAAARAVGRVVWRPQGHPVEPLGTAVLISERLLLTNHHVLPDPDEAAELSVQFGYEFADDGSERVPETYRLDPQAGWFTDPVLDFTIVAVADREGSAPGTRYLPIKLIGQLGKVLKGEPVNVIHHPRGDRKRVSIRENLLVAVDDLWLRYTSDTRDGSSGSPVFNDQWEMIALHHGGIPRSDSLAEPFTRGARSGDDGATGTDQYVANEGARVSRIIYALNTAELTEPTASLVQRALATGDES